MTAVLLLSGPNLNLLGTREPEIYGSATLDDHVDTLRVELAQAGIELEHLQSNAEAVKSKRCNKPGGGWRPSSSTPERSPITRGRCTTPWPPLLAPSWNCICPTRSAANAGATPQWLLR